MSLGSFAVKKPVTTMMIYLGIALMGIISVWNLPQELFPPVTFPQLTVVTTYPNAAPEEVENLVSKIIEEAVSTVKGLKTLKSYSREGTSLVIAEFAWGTNIDLASLGMREKIDLVKERLPREAEEPTVLKFNPFARPMMVLSVTGDIPAEDLLKVCKKILKDKLEKVKGVASATISGGRERQIYVDMNQAQLKASKVDILSVTEALKNSNLNYPGGSTKEKFYEYMIRTMGEFQHVDDIGKTVVSLEDVREIKRREAEQSTGGWEQQGGESDRAKASFSKRIITLNDVAGIKDDFKEVTSYSRFNGKENISISLQKQTNANTIGTVKLVKKELEKLKDIMPKEVRVDIVYDQSVFIVNAISSVADAAWQGGVLAFLVQLFFLKNLLNALIVTMIIPFSVLMTMSCMYFMGMSINIMSLAGMALGIGMLVDCAVCVTENTFRLRQEGMNNIDSAIKGTDQMTSAVTTSTLTNVAPFLPMIFVVGVIGQIFKDLALAVTFLQLTSLFVAMTLMPRLCAMTKKAFVQKPDFAVVQWIRAGYAKVLPLFIRYKVQGLGAMIALFVFSLWLMGRLDVVPMPEVDEGKFSIKLEQRMGTVLSITNDTAKKIEQQLAQFPEIENVMVRVGSNKAESGTAVESLGSNQAQILVTLKKDRKDRTIDFIQKVREKISKEVDVKDAQVNYLIEQSDIGAAFSGGADVTVDIKGQDIKELAKITEQVKEKLGGVEGLTEIKDTVPKPAPETKITVKKDKAATYGLSVRDVAQAALLAIKGSVATKLKEGGREIDIMVRLREEDRKNMDILRYLYLNTPQGFQIPMNDVVNIQSGMGPSEIVREDQQRTVKVLANRYGRALSKIEGDVGDTLVKMYLPNNYTAALGGNREETQKSVQSLVFALLLAILLIFMIMASQFESIVQPFLIMGTVPLSLIGVAITLFLTNIPMSGIAILGVIILSGIVVANGIVLIDYINQLRQEGEPLDAAVVKGCNTRLRPIMITAVSTVVGLIPMAIGIGDGAELWIPMAWTCIGGSLVSTCLTLFFIPALYLIIEGFRMKRKKA